jgi:enoyl-CoA hydratase/carnithine racemase
MSLVALETLAPGLARLRLRRPDKRNALNQELLRDAIAAIGAAEQTGAAVGILAAEGQAFCAGADLREASTTADSLTMVDLCDRLLDSSVYWIAAVQGAALGAGVALAAVCPTTLARRGAWVSLPEISLGMFPAVVVAYLEPRFGTKLAVEWALAGTRLPVEAEEMRPLFTEVIDSDQFDGRVAEYAERLTALGAPVAAARRAWQTRFSDDWSKRRRLQLFELMGGAGE